MNYLPLGMPLPLPSPEDGPFWEACRNRRLIVRHCQVCGHCFHPPTPSCVNCGSSEVEWKELPGTGTIYSYTIAHHAVHPALKGFTPYNVVVVLMDEADDVRLVSNLVDAGPDDIVIGEPVALHWEEIEEGHVLPRFHRRNAALNEGASS